MIKTQTELEPAAIDEDMSTFCRCEGAVTVLPVLHENGLQFRVISSAQNPTNDAYFLMLYAKCFYIVGTDKEYYRVIAENEQSPSKNATDLIKIKSTYFRMYLENPQNPINLAHVIVIDKTLEKYVEDLGVDE